MKSFKCPYNDFECLQVDTSGMSGDINCADCIHYHKGVRATGATPLLGWFLNLFKKQRV